MFRSAITLGALSVCFSLSIQVQAKPAYVPDDLDHVNFEGVVADANGGVIANARVIVRQTNTGAERSIKTNQEGRYRFTTLAPGVYELRVEAGGFQPDDQL